MWWKLVLLGALVVAAIFLFRYGGWLRYAHEQRKRERKFTVEDPKHRPKPAAWNDDQLTLSWLGHSTLLINFYGVHIVTDPVFSDAIGIRLMGKQFGPKRLIRSALTPEQLPRLDLIVQSHAHLDHLDVHSWKLLPRNAAVVMASQNSRHIRHLGFNPVHELHWGQALQVGGVLITAIEVRHWGERFPWSSWHGYNGYILERKGRSILFGGDTAYTEALRKACQGRKIDVAILPIGGYQPYIHAHAHPDQVWKMFTDMRADHLVPIHHQTFVLSHEPPDEPLRLILDAAGDQQGKIVVREIGQTFVFPEKSSRATRL